MSPNSSVRVPVTIVAPTETVIFTITSLPAGVSQNYKESESNPSGLLTLQANSLTKPGTYKPTIVVSTSGQTASLVFTLVVTAMSARAFFPSTDSQGTIQIRPGLNFETWDEQLVLQVEAPGGVPQVSTRPGTRAPGISQSPASHGNYSLPTGSKAS